MNVHSDCRHYRASHPCAPHKRSGVRCDRCPEYAPVEERILIVKLDAMGDVLRTTAVLEPLKRLHPRSHITWITRRESAAVLAGNALVDCVWSVDSNYLELLLAQEFDLALGPDADVLSASIMRIALAHRKRGFIAAGRGGVTPLNAAADAWWRMGLDDGLKRENRKTYGEWLYAICELPTPVARPWMKLPPALVDDTRKRLAAQAPGARRWIGFNTGASDRWREKRWKSRHYRRLSTLLRDRSHDVAIVVVGGPNEADLNAELLASGRGMIDGGTTNSVDEFAAVIASCDWLLTSDSLGYHVASAVNTPALCIAGPTSPWELDLYGCNQVVHANLDCIACYQNRCPRSMSCMDVLTADALWPVVEWVERSGSLRPGVSAVAIDGAAAAFTHALTWMGARAQGGGA